MISVYSKSHNKDYQEDLFPITMKDIANWNQSGITPVLLDYIDGVNNFVFGGVTASKLIEMIKSNSQYSNINLSDDGINKEKITKIIFDWKSSGKDLLFSRVHFQDVNAYCYCFFVPTDNNYNYSIDDNYYITITNGTIYRENAYSSSGNEWFNDLKISNRTTYNCTHIPLNFGKAADYEPNNKSFTMSFTLDMMAAINAGRIIDVLNDSTSFIVTNTTLEKNTVNLSNINDLLSVWKSNDNYKLNVVFCGDHWESLYLTLYTGNCIQGENNIKWGLKRYQKILYKGNWTTNNIQAEDSICSSQLTSEEFDIFNAFESMYSIPNGIPYLLTFDQKSSTGWEVIKNTTSDFNSFDELADYLMIHYPNLDVTNKSRLIKDLENNASSNYNNASNPYKVFILNERGENVYNYLYIAIVSSDDSLYWENNTLKSDNKSSVVLYTIGYDGTIYNNQNNIDLPLSFNISYFHEAFEFSLNTGIRIDHNIVLKNGYDTYNLDLNNTASDTYRTFNILFTPTDTLTTLKLDLSAMKGTQINLQIKDISLYKIG